jgi:hypothetical protein
MWRPLTDSRWARPERRIASASASSTEPWSPVASAVAIPPSLASWRGYGCRGGGAVEAGLVRGRRMVTSPSALPVAPRPMNQASRAKSWVPGSAIGIGGASRARRRTIAPTPSAGAEASRHLPAARDPQAWRKVGSRGARVRRRLPLATSRSAFSTSASKAAIRGRSRRGAATSTLRHQMSAQPSARRWRRQRSPARSAHLRPARRRPIRSRAAARRPRPAGRQAPARLRSRCQMRPLPRAQAGNVRPQGVFPHLRRTLWLASAAQPARQPGSGHVHAASLREGAIRRNEERGKRA